MNLKLKKVVKKNVVDYGTPDPISKGFEYKFQMFSIIKDYKKIFEKKSGKSPNQKHNNVITERRSVADKYFREIIAKHKTINRLKNLRNKFHNAIIKNNENFLYNINHMNDIYRIENSQRLHLISPVLDSLYNSKSNSTIGRFNQIKYDDKFDKNNIGINNEITKTNENEKMIYDYDYIKYKKINNIKNHYFKLKYKDYVRRKTASLNIKNINSINKDKNSDKGIKEPLKIKDLENVKVKIKESRSQNSSDFFQISEFNDYKTMKQLKTKYHFYHKNKVEIEDINTRYFLMLRNILKNNPGVKLIKDTKESQKIVKKIKTRYILRKYKK